MEYGKMKLPIFGGSLAGLDSTVCLKSLPWATTNSLSSKSASAHLSRGGMRTLANASTSVTGDFSYALVHQRLSKFSLTFWQKYQVLIAAYNPAFK